MESAELKQLETTAMPARPSQYEIDDHLHDTPYSTWNTAQMGQLDPQAKLLPSTPGSSRFRFGRSSDLAPQQYDPFQINPGQYKPRRSVCWPPQWHSSWNMYVFCAFGFVCAVGHHIFYDTLDGKPADNQIQMLRYGTLLAFGAKAGLCAAVVTAFRQRVWTTVQTRLLSIGALDSLFVATEDLISLWNWELFKGARVAMALAVFVWIAPLMVILSANTLLVEPTTMVQETTCPGVRTLNFSFEETNEWRIPKRIDGVYEIPISLWNTTKPPDQDPPGWFDYYTGPSMNIQQTATLGAFMGGVAPRPNASLEVCGSGWNCTFDIQFVAPGYKCTELASGVDAKVVNLTQESGSIAPPFSMDLLLPKGLFSYYAFTSGGEYSTTQMEDVSIGGMPKTKPPYPKNFGAFRTEPIVWIGYSVIVNPDRPLPKEPSDPAWSSSFIPKLFACENYETAYTARFNYTDTAQVTTITSRKFLTPVVNTTLVPGVDAGDDGTADNTTATPEANYVRPTTDVGRYRRAAAFHSLGFMLRRFVNGTVEMARELDGAIANTAAVQTRLLDQRRNFFPHPDLQGLVQGFYEDIVLSLLSNPQFVDVVWAARPDEQSGTLREGGVGVGGPGGEEAYRYPCVKSRTAIMYRYHARDLWIVYGIAIVLALVGVAVGAHAVRENDGAMRDTRFSSIVAATRGPALERVGWEDRGELPGDVKGLRLGYGMIPRGGPEVIGLGVLDGGSIGSGWKPGEMRYGFGLEGEVQQFR